MKNVTWTTNNTPKSENFGDVYYNKDSGLDEKKYVFVNGNYLESKFENLKNDFKILELGFGTGLSFLVTALEFAKNKTEYSLEFTSTELFPLDFEEMYKALNVWEDFFQEELVQRFLQEYKKADLTTNIEIKLDNISLKILIGDANFKLKELKDKQDCFFLDGFAPGKNESMWSESLFELVKGLTKKGSTASTYSASRVVKDRLEQAGFTYSKRKGFGHKRDMLQAEIR